MNNMYITLLKNRASPMLLGETLVSNGFKQTLNNKRTTIFENQNATISLDKRIIRINIYDTSKVDVIDFLNNTFTYGEEHEQRKDFCRKIQDKIREYF